MRFSSLLCDLTTPLKTTSLVSVQHGQNCILLCQPKGCGNAYMYNTKRKLGKKVQ